MILGIHIIIVLDEFVVIWENYDRLYAWTNSYLSAAYDHNHAKSNATKDTVQN